MPVPHSRLALSVTAALVLATGATSVPPAHASTGPAAAGTSTRAGALSHVHTVGRVVPDGSSVDYTWPGIYFDGRFRGTGVGIVLNDSGNDYDVQIDGAPGATLVTPGRTTYWVNHLTNARHTVRLVKRTESPWAAGQFGGFVAAPGGRILAGPAPRRRQIEFIGDSFTAGYGNTSGTRDCSSNGGVNRNSDADLSFGALTARSLGADYQINAQSGMGMVRNYAGSSPGVDFRTYYDRGLQNVDGDVWHNPRTWRPQLVVVGLGINDFSTSLNGTEKWPTSESLVADYKTAYQGFLDKLRTRYGRKAIIVVSATLLSNTTLFADAAQQIVAARRGQGDNRVVYWYYDDPNFDRLGCDWHPSVHDDQIISGLLGNFIGTLPLRW
jgi:lysophospholipase L1-like esterase